MDFLAFILLGISFGFIHALEPDHLIGVATIVSSKQGKLQAFYRGAVWGFGHALTILVVYLLFKEFGPVVEKALFLKLESIVGLMLIGLGLRIWYKLLKGKKHLHSHKHENGIQHLHFHSHRLEPNHEHVHLPFSIGIIHGLAGSGAIIVALTIENSNQVLGVVSIILFGLGSCVAMGLFSSLMVLLINKIGKWIHNFERVAVVSNTIIATVSCVLGYVFIINSGIF